MTSTTWASPRYVQELATIFGPQNRTQGSCVMFCLRTTSLSEGDEESCRASSSAEMFRSENRIIVRKLLTWLYFVSLSEVDTALQHCPYHQHTHGHPTLHSGMRTWLTTRQNATMTSGKEMINIGRGGEKTILRPKNLEILGGSEKIRWDWEFCAWKMQTRC